jgi:hypothetical protein
MATKVPNGRQWLQAEQNAQEELAELMFAQLIAEMPSVEVGAEFVNRTAKVAWRAHIRHRLIARCAFFAAALLIVVGGVASLYELKDFAVRAVVYGVVLFSHALVWIVTWATDGFRWWWIAERIGTAVRDGIADPSRVALLAAFEMIVLLATYAFRRLLVENLGQQKPR